MAKPNKVMPQDILAQLSCDLNEYIATHQLMKMDIRRITGVGADTLRKVLVGEYGVTYQIEQKLRAGMAAHPDGIDRKAPKEAVRYHKVGRVAGVFMPANEVQRRRDEVEAERLARHKALMEAERAQLSPIGRAKFSARPVWEMVA